MLKLRAGIVELFKKVATSLPPDVEAAIRSASEKAATGTNTGRALLGFLDGAKRARLEKSPLCAEIGVPVFYVKAPAGIGQKEIERTIVEATRAAVEKLPLSRAAAEAAKKEGFPEIHMEESEDDTLTVELVLMEAECESEGRLYRLPDPALGAGRDMEGVGKCVMDAVKNASGKGCPPYTIGVGMAGSRENAARLSKEQLRRKLDDRNPDPALGALEDRLVGDLNAPGEVLALGVKVGMRNGAEPAFVDVSLSCWATRRGKLIW